MKENSIVSQDDLKQRIAEEWDALPQEVIDRSIGAFTKRVRAVMKADGVHIERYV